MTMMIPDRTNRIATSFCHVTLSMPTLDSSQR